LNGEQVLAPERAVHIDNWLRLGLVTVDYISQLTKDTMYDWVEAAPLMVEARKRYDTDDVKRVVFQKGILRATDFGRAFGRVVIHPTDARFSTNGCEKVAQGRVGDLAGSE
jgi:hypothetical protein